MKKINFNKQLTTSEKRKFYFQELLEDYSFLNKYLVAIIIFIFIGNFARDRITETKINSLLSGEKESVFFILSASGVLLFIISSLSCFRRITKKSFIIRAIALAIGNILIGASIVWNMTFAITNYLESDNKDAWLILMYMVTDGIITVIVNDIINPIWYMKIIMPLSYCVGVVVAAINSGSNNSESIYLFLALEFVYFVLLSFLKEYFRWKLFLKKIEEERWVEIQKVILNNVPNLIVVINSNLQALYCNSEFEKVANGNSLDEFFQKIVSIKQGVGEEENMLFNMCLGQICKSPADDSPVNSLMVSSRLQRSSFLVSDKELLVDNLARLLKTAVNCLQQGLISDRTHLTFYGKMNDPKTNQNRSFEIILTPMVEHQNIIFILNDTTQRDLIVALENNNQYKDKLLASVSHELRTPLNANLTFIEAALRSDGVSRSIKETMLLPAHRSGKLLNFLVNDILDFCQIGANQLRLSWRNHSLKETIRACCQLLEIQVKAKLLDFTLEIDENISDKFKTDHMRVGQILMNLLNNALKFTFQGSITLKAEAIDAKNVKISVQDTGIGIKEEDQKKIFCEFVSLNENHGYTSNSKGVGLGLTISENLVKLLNPTHKKGIELQSKFQEGSTFSFMVEDCDDAMSLTIKGSPPFGARLDKHLDNEFQLESAISFEEKESPIRTTRDTSDIALLQNNFTASKSLFHSRDKFSSPRHKPLLFSKPSLLRKRILIVDDDPFNIWALRALFKPIDVEIDFAYNGKEAINKVTLQDEKRKSPRYHIIFMDCQMPVMDGFETTKILTEMMQTKKIEEIPIIGCTAFSDQGRLDAGYECGMKDILNKPISSSNLIDIWKKYYDEDV